MTQVSLDCKNGTMSKKLNCENESVDDEQGNIRYETFAGHLDKEQLNSLQLVDSSELSPQSFLWLHRMLCWTHRQLTHWNWSSAQGRQAGIRHKEDIFLFVACQTANNSLCSMNKEPLAFSLTTLQANTNLLLTGLDCVFTLPTTGQF